MKQNIAPMQLLLSIVERGSAAKLMRQYEAFKITQHFQAFGHGTAASHLLDTLGFGTSERDILLSIAPKDTMRQLMHFLKDEERSALGAKGIACSLDLTALSAIYALGISRLEEMNPDKGEQLMEQGNQHTLILVAVNYGYTDAVMDTAKTAGAKGGTVIRARWIGADEVQKHSGISLQSEKEILAILAKNEDRNAIMEEIERVHSLRSAAQGTLVSIPVDYTSKID